MAKASVVVCVLTERPDDARAFYHQTEFFHFHANAEDIDRLLAIEADIAILEPTGIHYARLWAKHLERTGCKVLYAPNTALTGYRRVLDLPDKDDEADALALACYWFDFGRNPKRFLRSRDVAITQMRDLILRLDHFNRLKTPIINRLRQELSWQFPEVAQVKSRSGVSDVPLLWGWMANFRRSTRYDRLYKATVGLGLTTQTRESAAVLCNFFQAEQSVEIELNRLVALEEFASYCEVFARFGFGLRLRCLILSQIYPLEHFLGMDGEPEVQFGRGRESGKRTKRRLSERRFKKALGLAPMREWSGDNRRGNRKSGSALCRKAFWQWVFCRVEVRRSRPKNEIGQILGAMMDEGKAQKTPIRKLRSAVGAKAAVLLFRELTTVVDRDKNI